MEFKFLDFFKKRESGSVAKDRLKLLLVTDRANCSPEIMEAIQRDIIEVISKYMEIDREALDIQITQAEVSGKDKIGPTLCANIPIVDMRARTAE